MKTEQAEAMAQVCLDMHAALGIKWGDDPYARIKALTEFASGEAVAWMWQHGETGATGFLANAPEDELRQWERMNKPRKIVCPLYAAPRAEPTNAAPVNVSLPETNGEPDSAITPAGNEPESRSVVTGAAPHDAQDAELITALEQISTYHLMHNGVYESATISTGARRLTALVAEKRAGWERAEMIRRELFTVNRKLEKAERRAAELEAALTEARKK